MEACAWTGSIHVITESTARCDHLCSSVFSFPRVYGQAPEKTDVPAAQPERQTRGSVSQAQTVSLKDRMARLQQDVCIDDNNCDHDMLLLLLLLCREGRARCLMTRELACDPN